ncbi:hypothetical protein BWP02_05820, partial [Neisseria gonorrhoeae]
RYRRLSAEHAEGFSKGCGCRYITKSNR